MINVILLSSIFFRGPLGREKTEFLRSLKKKKKFSVTGLGRAKFGFHRFQFFLFIVVIVISILLKTAF